MLQNSVRVDSGMLGYARVGRERGGPLW